MMRTSLFFAAASLIALSDAVALQPISGALEQPTTADNLEANETPD